MYNTMQKDLGIAITEGYHVVLFPDVKNLQRTEKKLMAFGVKEEVAKKTLQKMLLSPPECITFFPDVPVTVVYPFLWNIEGYVKKFVGEVVSLSETIGKRKIVVDGIDHPLFRTAKLWEKEIKSTVWFFST